MALDIQIEGNATGPEYSLELEVHQAIIKVVESKKGSFPSLLKIADYYKDVPFKSREEVNFLKNDIQSMEHEFSTDQKVLQALKSLARACDKAIVGNKKLFFICD